MPHVIYVAIGFPPAAKSSAHRMKATANLLCEQGCDVTVVTIERDAWRREYGLDPSSLLDVDPRVTIVELPLSRKDIDPDILSYSWLRARHRKAWVDLVRMREQWIFPEPVFGSWRRRLERALLDIHRHRPADFVLVSAVPYTGLAAAWKLWRSRRVPYAIDLRDAWSLDVINGRVAFRRRSRRGRWEAKLFDHAVRVWCVNEPIREHYVKRYSRVADRIHVVRNGSDLPPTARSERPNPAKGLTIGYLGTSVFPVRHLQAVLDGWCAARDADEVIARSQLVFRGYFGWQSADMADARRALLTRAAADGVVLGGPVPNSDVGAAYAEWDALLFLITGGRYMTSGKVYEYMASALPIMSAHVVDHGASEVLSGYPLWIPPPAEMTAELLGQSFLSVVRMAIDADDTQRREALVYAAQYGRRAQMAAAVRDLVLGMGDAGGPLAVRQAADPRTVSVLK